MFQVLYTAHFHSIFWLVTSKYAEIIVGFQFFCADTTCCTMDAAWSSRRVSSVRLVQHSSSSSEQVVCMFFWRACIVKNACFILYSCWTLQPLNTYMVYIIMLLVFIIREYWSSPNVVCRVKTNPKNAINEHFLPRFLDFIVWGHEHECLVDPQVLQNG